MAFRPPNRPGGPADRRSAGPRPVVVALAIVLGSLATGCSDGGEPAADASALPASPDAERRGVPVVLDEYAIVTQAEFEAGSVTLAVENDGTENHQLTIVAAESYEALPQRDNGSVRVEALEPSALVVSTEPSFAGFPAEPVTVTLQAGTYVFFCNLQSFTGDKSHVGLGQRLVVTVD